jgi:hypothetical protein
MKFRLLGPAVLSDGQQLDAGTEIGDDTPYPYKNPDGSPMEPSTTMEGLDEDGKKAVHDLHRRLFGHGPYWESGQSEEVRKARETEAEEQRKLDESSEPVSEQQHLEREWQKERDKRGGRAPGEPAPTIPPKGPPTATPGPARQVSGTETANPTRGGVASPAPGPATAKPPDKDEARPKRPNEEQYPKG